MRNGFGGERRRDTREPRSKCFTPGAAASPRRPRPGHEDSLVLILSTLRFGVNKCILCLSAGWFSFPSSYVDEAKAVCEMMGEGQSAASGGEGERETKTNLGLPNLAAAPPHPRAEMSEVALRSDQEPGRHWRN